MSPRLVSSLVVLCLVLSPPQARAQLEPPSSVPGGLSANEASELSRERAALVVRLDALVRHIDSHDRRCSHVPDTDTALVASCQRSRAAVRQELDAYRSAAAAYEQAVAAARTERRRSLENRIVEARAKIKADQEQFRRLGIATVSDAFETWSNLTDDQRREFDKATILSALSLGLGMVRQGSHPVGSFTPAQAASLIGWLQRKGVTEPFLEEAIRKIAITSGKPEMARNVRELADVIEKAIANGGVLTGLSNGQLEALATVPATFLKSPEAKTAEALGETIVNFYFAQKALGVIEVDMNQVINLPEQQLASVNRLSAAMKNDVRELNRLKAELAGSQ